jgi:hypothetical protein
MSERDREDWVVDRGLDLVEAGAAVGALAVPATSLLALVLGKIPRSRQRRVEAMAVAASDALEAVSDRLDRDYVLAEEFQGLVEEVMERADRKREQDKREAYAAILVNAALPGRPDEETLQRMVDTLEDLRVRHLRLLAVIMRTHDPTSSFKQEFLSAVSNWDTAVLDWGDLERAGVVSVMPSDVNGADAAGVFRSRVTSFGRLFHQFVVLPPSDSIRPRDGEGQGAAAV